MEGWLVRAVGRKLLDARMDQTAATVTVTRCSHRSFGEPQWEELRDRLASWKAWRRPPRPGCPQHSLPPSGCQHDCAHPKARLEPLVCQLTAVLCDSSLVILRGSGGIAMSMKQGLSPCSCVNPGRLCCVAAWQMRCSAIAVIACY